ncbi:MAG: SGNH/GDSL hydrolase family protein [Bacteroidales bacterium]|nr:SGNH/GDSL hydrolase family protein [Bacteroidales bacterium]
MKRLTLILILFTAVSARAQVWHDAAQMHIFGKAVEDTYTPFVRFPEDINEKARKALKYLGGDAAGLYVQFRTDSPAVHVRWTSVKKLTMSHMASVGSRGVDLYAKTDAGWRFVGSARPALDYNETTRCIVKKMDAGYKEFRMYLSLYDGISKLEIGTEPGCEFIPVSVDKRKAPVVMYGTSILQGGCVSRPGMAFTNILGRMLDREVVNLGFSGNARLDPEIAELMARVENPAVFVLDNVPNDTPELILERGEAFVKILRDAHPAVPIVFVEMAHYSHDFVSSESYTDVEARNAAQHTIYERVKAAGDKNLYYVSGKDLNGSDGEATVDYVHTTDLGQLRYAQVLYPILKGLIK